MARVIKGNMGEDNKEQVENSTTTNSNFQENLTCSHIASSQT